MSEYPDPLDEEVTFSKFLREQKMAFEDELLRFKHRYRSGQTIAGKKDFPEKMTRRDWVKQFGVSFYG